jgi:predicted amidohydrolase
MPLVAIAQLCSTANKASNMAAITRLAKEASKQSAKFLFLPECFSYMSECREDTLGNAEIVPSTGTPLAASSDGSTSTIHHLQHLAKTNNLWLSAGGIHESGPPPSSLKPREPRVWNTHVIIDNEGTVRGKYRKVHLFDITIPGRKGFNLMESATTCPGDEYVIVEDTIIGNIGMGTCYDMRFGDQARALLNSPDGRGADVLLFPSGE